MKLNENKFYSKIIELNEIQNIVADNFSFQKIYIILKLQHSLRFTVLQLIFSLGII